jgi:hypothetical protein
LPSSPSGRRRQTRGVMKQKGEALSCNHIGIKKQKEAKDRLYFFLFSSFCFP